MLENLFTNVFGRPKNKSSDRNAQQQQQQQRQQDQNTSSGGQQPAGYAQMTGPFSSSMPQMPHPPALPYPPAPYPGHQIGPTPTPSTYYPSLPFSQPPPLPGGYGSNHGQADASSRPHHYPSGTLSSINVSPLDSVPFEAKLMLNNSTNLVSLDQLFKDIKKSAEIVDRVDAYLRSNNSDYDFKTELGLMQ